MRIADHPKKFGLLLLPLIPLTAIGVVEVSDRVAGTETCTCAPAPIRDDLPKPVLPVRTQAPHPAPPA